MKKFMLFSLFLLLFQVSYGQFKWGLRGGLSTTDIKMSELLVTNASDANALKIKIKEANYGYHLGIFTQIKMGNFFIQPEFLYNSTSTDFEVDDFSNPGTITKESYKHLDIPIMAGFKFGPVRLQGGPVGHIFLDSTSDFFDFEGYKQDFKTLTVGYQAGIGLDIWKFLIDVKYEGSLNKFGDHITFFGKEYNFDDRPGRIVASLGFTF